MKILSRLIAVNHSQKGFTVVELMAAIVIAAIIGVAATTLTYQLVKMNTTSVNRQTAISLIENVVNSISRDAQQAQQIPTSTNNNMVLNWTEWNDTTKISTLRTVTYDSTSGDLKRNSVVIANDTNFTSAWNSATKVLSFTVTTTVGSTTVSRTIQINPRPAQ
jgi:prepilin-type N-terminal cleavage/methylation domain-containing protein